MHVLKGRCSFALSVWHVARANRQPVAAVERQRSHGESRSGEFRSGVIKPRVAAVCVSLCQPTPPSTAKSFGAHEADAARKDLD